MFGLDHTLINWGQANAGGHSKGSSGLGQVKRVGGGEVLGVEEGWVEPAASENLEGNGGYLGSLLGRDLGRCMSGLRS